MVVLVALYFIVGIFAPSSYKVERVRTIAAPAEMIYTEISNLTNWTHWSPWEQKDSTMVNTFEGPAGAIGSKMKWKGNPETSGEGEIEIIELIPNEKIGYKLTFVDWNAVSTGTFSLKASGDSTKVSWTNEGEIAYMMRTMFWLSMDMDKMMGPDFEAGLANIDSVCQTLKAAQPALPQYEIISGIRPAEQFVGLRYDTTIVSVDSTLFKKALDEVGTFLAEKKIEPTGPPVCLTYLWDDLNGRCDLMIGFPVSNATSYKFPKNYFVQVMNRQSVITTDYYGRYDNIWMAHASMSDYLLKNGIDATVSIEEYITDPTTVSTWDSVLTRLSYYTDYKEL